MPDPGMDRAQLMEEELRRIKIFDLIALPIGDFDDWPSIFSFRVPEPWRAFRRQGNCMLAAKWADDIFGQGGVCDMALQPEHQLHTAPHRQSVALGSWREREGVNQIVRVNTLFVQTKEELAQGRKVIVDSPKKRRLRSDEVDVRAGSKMANCQVEVCRGYLLPMCNMEMHSVDLPMLRKKFTKPILDMHWAESQGSGMETNEPDMGNFFQVPEIPIQHILA